MNPQQAIELMTQVDAFYKNAWDHFMIYATFLMAILGLLVPALTYLYQKRLFQEEESRLNSAIEQKIKEEIDRITKDLKRSIQDEFVTQTKKTENDLQALKAEISAETKAQKDEATKAIERIDRAIARSRGSIYHVQMNVSIDQEHYAAAFGSAYDAIDNMIKANDRLNLRRVANSLVQEILPKLSSAELAHCESENNPLEEHVNRLIEMTRNGDLDDLIYSIRAAYKQARERK